MSILMQTLNFGQIMDSNDYWFEDYDLSCPFCGSQDEECEQCNGQMFEVMWNTAFGLTHLKIDLEKAKKIAWNYGFCLIEHDEDNFLLMGCCGQDMTWIVHFVRWQIQGHLSQEDMESVLNSGGHVFLRKGERDKLIKYIKETMMKPEIYQMNYESNQKSLDSILDS